MAVDTKRTHEDKDPIRKYTDLHMNTPIQVLYCTGGGNIASL
jgi:hypothetical protein